MMVGVVSINAFGGGICHGERKVVLGIEGGIEERRSGKREQERERVCGNIQQIGKSTYPHLILKYFPLDEVKLPSINEFSFRILPNIIN